MGGDASAYEAAYLDTLDSGKYDVFITATTGGLGDLTVRFSGEYPDYKFIVFDVGRTLKVETGNLVALTYRQNEGAYLGGAFAALMSRTGKIGIYLHADSPVLNDFVTGYYQGASDINIDIVIYTAYGAGVSGDSARSTELTSVMLNSGADIIYGCAASSNPGLFQNVIERGGFSNGLYAIGSDFDQWYKYTNSNSPLIAGGVITSVVKNVGDSLVTVWDELESGKLSWGKLYFFGITEDSMGLAKNEYYKANVPADIQARLDEIEIRIRSGEVKVKSYFDFAAHDEFLAYTMKNKG
jgi:basic membrane protein A